MAIDRAVLDQNLPHFSQHFSLGFTRAQQQPEVNVHLLKMGNEIESEPSSVPYGILENGATFADLESGDRAASSQRGTENNSYHYGEDCSVIIAAAAAMEQVETDETRFATKRSQTEEEDDEQQRQQQQNLAKRNQPQSVRMLSKRLVLVNLLANFLMFAIAGFITYHCFNKATVLFSWHPTFMAVGAQMDSNFTPDQVPDVEMTNLRNNYLDVAVVS